jgi:transposase InsO family protein
VRQQCSALEKRILEQRRAHPEHGVRRIRDDLRRQQGLAVSAEKVRTVVNDAGLGEPPPTPHRNPPSVRRFERALPNALWQIDIFTFHLKRLYQVYLVGIIDDHSRFLVGWGLFRQQTTEAVLEVVKGAIGQWGAPREILSDNVLTTESRGLSTFLCKRPVITAALERELLLPDHLWPDPSDPKAVWLSFSFGPSPSLDGYYGLG